jgi:hypothetical protein
MLVFFFTTSAWRHSASYSNSDLPEASHHYFDSSWDLAFVRAQANSQREHKSNTRKRAHDSLSNPKVSQSEGVHSTSPVQVPTARASSPLRTNGHSDSLATTHPAPDAEEAVIFDIVLDDDTSTLDPLDTTMRLFDESAELATQHPPTLKASPLPVLARTPLGDDDASPNFDDSIPIVSQFSYTYSPSTQFDSPSK